MGADAGGWEGMVWCAPADNGTCHLYHIGGLKGCVVVVVSFGFLLGVVFALLLLFLFLFLFS